MTVRSTLRALGSTFILALLAPVTLAPGCTPKDPPAGGPDQTGMPDSQDLDPCTTPLRVLATIVLERDKGKPSETTLPFELSPEAVGSSALGAPVCVTVTSLEAKPHVLASGRFTIDDKQILGPSSFNENTTTATAIRLLAAGPHALTARIASAPGTRVRVNVLLGSAKPLPDDLVSSAAVVVPDKQTTINVAGAKLTFPVGAVDAPMPVTAFETVEPYGLSNRIELLPDGMKFNKPVTIELPYDPMRLPATVTEADLLALNAIQVHHAGEWRPTTIDSANHVATALLDHFSAAQVESFVPLQYGGAGSELWRDARNHVFIARIPLNKPGFQASILATKLTTNPNNGDALGVDSAGKAAFELKQVKDHLAQIDGAKYQKLGLNLGTWVGLTCDKDSFFFDDPDCGGNDTSIYGTGIGRPLFTARSTESPGDSYYRAISCAPPNGTKCVGVAPCDFDGVTSTPVCIDEYLIMVGTAKGGLQAKAFSKNDYYEADKSFSDPSYEHAILMGSTTSLVRTTLDKNTNKLVTTYRDPADLGKNADPERRSVVGFSDKYLILVATIGEDTLDGSALLAVLKGDDDNSVFKNDKIKNAILLDGGHSTSMVRNAELVNPLREGLLSGNFSFAPARRVIDALAVSYESAVPIIDAPSYTGTNRLTPIQVTLGTDPNNLPIKVLCSSMGSNYESSPFDSKWLPSGTKVTVPMTWTTPGSKTIFCTIYDQTKLPSYGTPRNIEVAEVDEISPSTVTLNQLTTFTITGKNLPKTTVAFIPECNGPNPAVKTLFTSGSSSESRTFTCTPGGAPGKREALVKHAQNGSTLRDEIDVYFVQ